MSKPTANVGLGSEWHIGNVEIVPDEAVSFAMGRTAVIKTERFDESSHNFLEGEAVGAPFTIGVFDTLRQTCAIIKRSGVSQNSTEIARKLQILLNAAGIASESNVDIVVDPIWDAQPFLEALSESRAVSRFRFTASPPNPSDVEKLIQEPAEEFAAQANADRAIVSVEGKDLNKETLINLTHAVAAVGEDASATIYLRERGAPKHIQLRGHPIIEPIEHKEGANQILEILGILREAYHRVRHTISEN